MADVIILGEGVFSIGGTPIALTRGGGKFEVKREFKEIEADGDLGKVKGRIRKTKSEATLTLNALKIVPADLPKMFAATEVDTTTEGHTILQAKGDVEDTDYQATVTWTGKTKAGKAVVITLENAINLEGISWELKDKDEVVSSVAYTACYDEDDRTEPWKVDFDTSDTAYTVTFTVSDGDGAVEGATVAFNNTVKTTNESGVAVFAGVPTAINRPYTVLMSGYNTVDSSVTIDSDETVAVTIVAI